MGDLPRKPSTHSAETVRLSGSIEELYRSLQEDHGALELRRPVFRVPFPIGACVYRKGEGFVVWSSEAPVQGSPANHTDLIETLVEVQPASSATDTTIATIRRSSGPPMALKYGWRLRLVALAGLFGGSAAIALLRWFAKGGLHSLAALMPLLLAAVWAAHLVAVMRQYKRRAKLQSETQSRQDAWQVTSTALAQRALPPAEDDSPFRR